MTKREFKSIFKLIDNAKWELFRQGIAFDLNIRFPDGECWHAGIGTAEQMCELSVRSLYNLYRSAKKEDATPEQFAEGMKQVLIRYILRHEKEGGEDE